jgi:hypothetical protein
MDHPDRMALLELERQRCEALGNGDSDALRTYTSSDYVHVHGNGRVERFEEYLSRLGSSAYRHTERGDLEVRLHGACAIVTGPLVTSLRRRDGDPLLRITGFATQVWVREGGSWRHVSFQLTTTEPDVEIAG